MKSINLSSRNNAQGEWNDLLPSGRTIWKVKGQLYTSQTRHVSSQNTLELVPITQDEIDYLESRGINL